MCTKKIEIHLFELYESGLTNDAFQELENLPFNPFNIGDKISIMLDETNFYRTFKIRESSIMITDEKIIIDYNGKFI